MRFSRECERNRAIRVKIPKTLTGVMAGLRRREPVLRQALPGHGWRCLFHPARPFMGVPLAGVRPVASLRNAGPLTSMVRLSVPARGRGPALRACLKIARGAAARDFGCGPGGEVGASPQRAVTTEPTLAQAKRPAARRVIAPQVVRLRGSSVTDPPVVFSFVTPRHPTFCPKTAPRGIFRQTLRD